MAIKSGELTISPSEEAMISRVRLATRYGTGVGATEMVGRVPGTSVPRLVRLTSVTAGTPFSGTPPMRVLVGAAGFEPAASCSQSRCATRLRYAP